MSRGELGGRRRGPVRRWVVDRLIAPVQRGIAEAVATSVRAEVDRAVQAVVDAEFRARRDLLAVGERDAALTSAHWAAANMPTAHVYTDPEGTLRHGLDLAPKGGLALEFGVFAGRSLRIIAEARKGHDVYGFDSFEGLPEDYRPHVREGAFAVAKLPQVDGAELVKGWFEDTLPGFLADHPGPVHFLHIDGDLYSSAVTVLEHVGPRLQPGSIVVFDEFFNFPDWQRHEFRAWQEWLERSGTAVSYEAYTVNNEQVVARILGPEEARGNRP